jgi:hypothetical protein
MPWIRTSKKASESHQEPPGRLPLRWAVILATAAVASTAVGEASGLPAAIGVFFMVAGALHMMVG